MRSCIGAGSGGKHTRLACACAHLGVEKGDAQVSALPRPLCKRLLKLPSSLIMIRVHATYVHTPPPPQSYNDTARGNRGTWRCTNASNPCKSSSIKLGATIIELPSSPASTSLATSAQNPA